MIITIYKNILINIISYFDRWNDHQGMVWTAIWVWLKLLMILIPHDLPFFTSGISFRDFSSHSIQTKGTNRSSLRILHQKQHHFLSLSSRKTQTSEAHTAEVQIPGRWTSLICFPLSRLSAHQYSSCLKPLQLAFHFCLTPLQTMSYARILLLLFPFTGKFQKALILLIPPLSIRMSLR